MRLNLSIRLLFVVWATCLLITTVPSGSAQDKPYFVTYSHDLEERGEMCVETKTALAKPHGYETFGATAIEFEYGVRDWWTADAYVDAQTTDEDSAMSTGYRLESRLRPTRREHLVTPVIYLEYGNITGADKTFLEVVGHDIQTDMTVPNDLAKRVHKHEGEFRLILSSDLDSWNVAVNLISEKNLGHAPWEFGYAFGLTRPLRRTSFSNSCRLCAGRFVAGVEVYGGLGDTRSLSLRETSHYLAPLLGWEMSKQIHLSLSPGFGLTAPSFGRSLRAGIAYEFAARKRKTTTQFSFPDGERLWIDGRPRQDHGRENSGSSPGAF